MESKFKSARLSNPNLTNPHYFGDQYFVFIILLQLLPKLQIAATNKKTYEFLKAY